MNELAEYPITERVDEPVELSASRVTEARPRDLVIRFVAPPRGSTASRMMDSGMDTAAITWLGHATVMIEIDGARLLTDPVIRDRIGPLVRIAPGIPRESLGRVDGVLLSHLHADHLDLPSLRQIARDLPVLAPHPSASWLRRQGLRDVREVRPGAELTVGGALVTTTYANHDRSRRPLGPAAQPVGYLIGGSRAVYFAGDTDLFDAMADLNGCVAAALLPVWGWGPTLGPGHLDPERAAEAAALIGPELAIPIHWGTFALGWPAKRAPDPHRPAVEFAQLVRRRAPAVAVRILAPGQRTEFRFTTQGGSP